MPARKVDEDLLTKGIQVIESWGLKIRMGKHCISAHNNYLAASDHSRLQDVQDMLNDPAVDVIFCARGGYGTTRILDQLDFTQLQLHPKWIIGFSDITALHLKLHKLGIESVHGCMPVQYTKTEYNTSIESLRKLLFGEPVDIKVDPVLFNRTGTANGQVIGGNLSLVVDSLATDSEIDTRGKILILEEIDEYLYRIDRMFVQLKRANKLSDLAGLIIGHMTDLKDTELPFNQDITHLILDKIRDYNYPVAFNFPVGHDAPNLAWRHGGAATLTVNEKESTLTFK